MDDGHLRESLGESEPNESASDEATSTASTADEATSDESTAIDRRSLLATVATATASGLLAGGGSAATSESPSALVDQMTLAEKTSMTYGVNDGAAGIGHITGISRLGIPDIKITDGPLGVIGAGNAAENYTATAFPANLAVAATFDRSLATHEGDSIAREVKDSGNQQLFAPAMNIGRYPGCGRLFDYYSGDPYLSGEMGANFVQGVQGQGVVSTVKHFVANNQDYNRKNRNEIIPERALREIYLSGFKKALLEGGAGSAMGAYNRVNGTFCTEHSHLLQTVLRDEWGWDGYVCSDYCAVHGTVDPANNGLDVSTGCAQQYFGSNLETAVNNGQVAESTVDTKVERLLGAFDETGHLDGNLAGDPPVANTTEHQNLSRTIAEEGSVLLKNDGTLPLDASSISTLSVLGHQNGQALVSDSLSSDVDPPYQVAPSDAIWDRANANTTIHYNDVAAAQSDDVAIVYAGEEVSEGVDRQNIDLPSGQNSTISDVASQNPNTVVVLRSPGPVEMPWIDQVAAVVEMWYPGMEDGNAAVNVLFGDTDPGGKLPITFGQAFEDYPAYQNPEYPGVQDSSGTYNAEYTEGIFVDYRWFDQQGIEPLFPFGHGLSYTSFSYSNVSAPASADFGNTVSVSVDVTNTGSRTGTEVVQLYVEDVSSSLERPPKELKGFEKVELAAGASTTVTLELTREDFTFWDPSSSSWVAENGDFVLHVGSSSRDIRGTATVTMSGGTDEGSGGGGGGGGGGGTSQSAYNGPHSLPGTLQAQDYDTGGEGTAYHDTTSGNTGGAYRSDDVDLETTSDSQGGSYNVGWIASGEWLEYTTQVDADGDYDVAARVASASGGGTLTISAEGQSISTSFAATGGWQTWTTVDVGTLSLTAGETVVRVTADAGGWNLNFLDVASGGGADTTAPTAPANLSSPGQTTTSVDLSWSASSDSGGSGLDHYTVYVDGAADHDVAAGTTSTTVSGLSAGTSYDFHVTAVDGAGNESAASNTVTVSTSSSSSGGITPGATYQITNVNSGKALDVANVSTSDGANVHQWAYVGGDNQHWTVEETSSGVYRLTAVHSGKVLDVANASTSDGANVQQWADFGNDNQRFNIEETSSGVYRIVAVHSGKVLDVDSASTSDGANVQQWADAGGDNQRWEFQEV